MKKSSTVAKRGNEIFRKPKLTIGLDLGDRTSHRDSGAQPANDTERNPSDVQQDPAQSDRAGNRDPFPVGKPAADAVGARSDRGPCT